MDNRINIITLGDVFDNLETDEKAYKFVAYIKNLQNENKQLKDNWEKLEKWIGNKDNLGFEKVNVEDIEIKMYKIKKGK